MSTHEQKAAAKEAAKTEALRKNAADNLPKIRTAPPPAPADGTFSKVVHAYRRTANMVGDPPKEIAVEVEFGGHRTKFHSNEHGHVVGTVTDESVFKRLVKGIPEAYIEYDGGENLPARVKPGLEEPEVGKFVLVNGDNKMRLDDLNDEELQEFAKANGLVVHESLSGDDLRQAIFNSFQTGENAAPL